MPWNDLASIAERIAALDGWRFQHPRQGEQHPPQGGMEPRHYSANESAVRVGTPESTCTASLPITTPVNYLPHKATILLFGEQSVRSYSLVHQATSYEVIVRRIERCLATVDSTHEPWGTRDKRIRPSDKILISLHSNGTAACFVREHSI
jgi:hypothetical protein